MTARALPEVPKPADLDPAEELWPSGKSVFRLFDRSRDPLEFNPTGSSARFRPIVSAKGAIVPTAYGGDDEETALAEALLRGVDVLNKGTRRRLFIKDVKGVSLVRLEPKADVRLARLRGQGLTRLGLTRADVIDCESSRYPYTAEWGQAIHDCAGDFAGIVWTSRQNDSGRALMLWGDRIDPPVDLRVVSAPIALDCDPGIDLVRQACAYAGFDFEG